MALNAIANCVAAGVAVVRFDKGGCLWAILSSNQYLFRVREARPS
jgi:hypothetical protein